MHFAHKRKNNRFQEIRNQSYEHIEERRSHPPRVSKEPPKRHQSYPLGLLNKQNSELEKFRILCNVSCNLGTLEVLVSSERPLGTDQASCEYW